MAGLCLGCISLSNMNQLRGRGWGVGVGRQFNYWFHEKVFMFVTSIILNFSSP